MNVRPGGSRSASHSSIPVHLVGATTLLAGILNLVSVLGPALPERLARLEPDVPLEFLDVSRFASLTLGFVLVVSTVAILGRKRRAYWLVVTIAAASVAIHLARGPHWPQALSSSALLALLAVSHPRFTVASGPPRWGTLGSRVALGITAALAYGVIGFWLLDRRDFGLEFDLLDSIHRSLRVLSLVADPGVVPHTRYARRFLDSLQLLSFLALGYAVLSLFRPAVYRLGVAPRQRDRARRIVVAHGRCATDFFKPWPDKSLLFSPDSDSFLAYRVALGVAISLGDPVGPAAGQREALLEFMDFCDGNGWQPVFHQTLPDFLPLYAELGFHRLKIGDEAIVDLLGFGLEGKPMKEQRNRIHRLERQGLAIRHHEPPLPDGAIDAIETVSNAWLTLPGRRERRFSVGWFDRDYVRATPVDVVTDGSGRALAFVNVIPSYFPSETTIDLMRHRPDAPNGVMDYVLVSHMVRQKEAGFARFNLGLAPLAGFTGEERPTPEELALHAVVGRLDRLFSFRGLRRYKAKFATSWEPRYLIYKRRSDLPRIGLALRRVAEIGDDE